jgi:hypothetical protein
MATVMEFLHTATLVHDDIIDNADTRRNRPTVNALYGNETAVLMGDWLYMSAFETSLAERSLPILDILTSVTRKMTEGELLQLTLLAHADVTEAQYFDVLKRKTAYLFSASCEIGAILGGVSAKQQTSLRDYGLSLGTAFQLIDDLLDFTSNEAALGKAAGADLLGGKVTLSDLDPPAGYRISGEGEGGVAGFAKGSAVVRLADSDGGTTLSYEVEAQIGGKLAQLGQRLINGAAKKLADEFFANFAKAVQG